MGEISVIQLIDSLNVGGAEMVSVNIANTLSKSGLNSHICATRSEGDLKEKICEEVGFLFLQREKFFDIKALKSFSKYIKKHSISIIHAHSTSLYFAIQIKLLNRDVKVIWHDHYGISSDYSNRPKRIIKFCSRYVSTILSVNTSLKNWAEKELKCKNVIYLPNFADLKVHTKVLTTLKGTDNKRITIIAGLRPQKDHLNLFKAFKTVNEQYPEWTLHVVGKDYEDTYSDKLHSFIKSNNLSNRVFFYGVRKDVDNILEQTEISVLSSKSEGLPVALLEYGLSKTPAIVTDVGLCKEVLHNDLLVAPAGVSDKLANVIKYLISNEKIRKDEGMRFYNRVKNIYGKENYVQKLIGIYEGTSKK